MCPLSSLSLDRWSLTSHSANPQLRYIILLENRILFHIYDCPFLSQIIDEEAHKIISSAMERTIQLLTEHKADVEKVGQSLVHIV